MEFIEALQEIKRIVPANRGLTKSKEKNKYNCIFCNSGRGRNGTGAMTYYPDQNILYCHACHNSEIDGKRADCINVQMKLYNQTLQEAVYQLADECNIIIDGRDAPGGGLKQFNTSQDAPQRPQNVTRKGSEEMTAPTENNAQNATQEAYTVKEPTPYQFKEYIEQCQGNASKAIEYLQGRGIAPEMVERFHIGYDPEKSTRDKDSGTWHKGAVIFPHTADYSYYSCRSIEGKGFYKPKESEAGKQPLFNAASLYREKPCFVCEGVPDALSIITAGGEAVALVGTGARPLLKEIEKKKPTHTLILSLDNDAPKDDGSTPGQDGQKKLAAELDKLEIPYIMAQYALDQYENGDRKDANDLLRANAGQLARDIEANEKKAIEATPSTRPDNTLDYINKIMAGEIEKLKADAGRTTGFPNLDDETGSIYSGLYVIGGISSVGKTTFAAQMADQMAARGQHVLFFSLEQSRLEMVSKSIARGTAIIEEGKTTTSLQIRLGANGENIRRAYWEYMQAVGDRVSIIEGNFNYSAVDIRAYTEKYIKDNNARPCVFVDYLQILSPIPDPETGRKPTDQRQITDANVTALKRMSRDLEIPVIVVSSLNRGNYLAPIDFESFKESGCIEYSADVILGVQLKIMSTDEIFSKTNASVTDKRVKVSNAKAANPREIELVCLKNRYGAARFSCYFKYYPACDYYFPCNEDGDKRLDFKPLSSTGAFHQITTDELDTIPFKA